MGYYYSIRGWLEVTEDRFRSLTTALESIIASHPIDSKFRFYAEGWCWKADQINTSRFIFYGADVKKDGLISFEDTLRKLLESGPEVYGYFHVQGQEDEDAHVYRLEYNTFKVEKASHLYDTSWRREDYERWRRERGL